MHGHTEELPTLPTHVVSSEEAPVLAMFDPSMGDFKRGIEITTFRRYAVARSADDDIRRDICVEAEVKLIACQMTVELFGMDKGDFIPEIADWVGAASFLPVAQRADVNLFV